MIGVLDVRFGDDGGLPFITLSWRVDDDLDLRLPLVCYINLISNIISRR